MPKPIPNGDHWEQIWYILPLQKEVQQPKCDKKKINYFSPDIMAVYTKFICVYHHVTTHTELYCWSVFEAFYPIFCFYSKANIKNR